MRIAFILIMLYDKEEPVKPEPIIDIDINIIGTEDVHDIIC